MHIVVLHDSDQRLTDMVQKWQDYGKILTSHHME